MRLWLRRISVGATAVLVAAAICSAAVGLFYPLDLGQAFAFIALSSIILLAALVFAIAAILLRPGAFER